MKKLIYFLPFLILSNTLVAQFSRSDIPFNNQSVFLNGGNIAWVNFARDVGPGTTNLSVFNNIFKEMSDAGGNSMRLWLHTTGATTPQWSGNQVIGPGVGAIADLEAILNAAWDNDIGLILCLWSFDMLRISNGTGITDRAYELLTDASLTQAYIDNALVPMVDSLSDHPAIIAWEIFNEPEGMSNEFGWDFNRHVPMSDIQRFINLTAGAIHRTAPNMLVTNGSWSFLATSDSNPAIAGEPIKNPSKSELETTQEFLSGHYGHPFTLEETQRSFDILQSQSNVNYYTDERLISAGGDQEGYLDFYTVHYYEWAGTSLSPFHHDYLEWGLDKPLVVAEFFMGSGSGDGDPDAVFGIPYQDLYPTLYERGYAGSMAWQWYNYPNGGEGVENWPRILEGSQSVFDLYPQSVLLNPGFRIFFFRAEMPEIEEGGSTTISWSVSHADEVFVDDVRVDSIGSQVVFPDQETTYTIKIIDNASMDTLQQALTVDVLAPNEINRARFKAATASSIERCCGTVRSPTRAFDGDPNTRWSSTWNEDEADANPDNEWISVDLGQSYDVEGVILEWETAFGTAYDIETSLDGHYWNTVFEERNGDGSIDEIVFGNPIPAQHIRMTGLDRATEYGYSLWEFEVFGVASELQPPRVSLFAPNAGALLTPLADTLFQIDSMDPDGMPVRVDVYVNDIYLNSDDEEPFEVEWISPALGDYTIELRVTDNDSLSSSSGPIPVFVLDQGPENKIEAESANYIGDVESKLNGLASGLFYLEMQESGSITFEDIEVNTSGQYLVTFKYFLLEDGPSVHTLRLNDSEPTSIRFSGPKETWQTRAIKAQFNQGLNTLTIASEAGWIILDYIGTSTDAVNVSNENVRSEATSFRLFQNYPNPVSKTTRIEYTIPKSSDVKLTVFDILGKNIQKISRSAIPSGKHHFDLDVSDLPSGHYFYLLETDNFTAVKGMNVLRH